METSSEATEAISEATKSSSSATRLSITERRLVVVARVMHERELGPEADTNDSTRIHKAQNLNLLARLEMAMEEKGKNSRNSFVKLLVPNSSSHLVKVFVHLPLVRRITIQNDFLQYLDEGASPEKLSRPCLCLNFISITVSFCYADEVLTALCLLGSAPALQVLKIQASVYGEDSEQVVNSWYDDNQNCQFSQLRLVTITNVSGFKAELDIIRFLLSCSPVLERMTVEPASDVVSSKLLKELVQFRRASPRAEIIYLGTLE
ncbi:F-box/FBD/LRR-repeat protein At1g13570-like [Pyrus x bretschneideri]|uniref:F-box/FBD/LRR-repeat protein At1g13570-like n=1 Tax=Pyrus x bretschneideri TaxID=225117 RepID=UPI00202E8985|nr:F-box/FBD/LRR-repeat protein At1g13570-like [Pyrus x bretschneideri]